MTPEKAQSSLDDSNNGSNSRGNFFSGFKGLFKRVIGAGPNEELNNT